MEFKAKDLAKLLGAELSGNPNIVVNNIAGIEKAKNNDITFVSNPRYEKYLKSTQAGIIILKNELAQANKDLDKTFIISDNPYLTFTTLLKEYEKFTKYSVTGISKKSDISDTAIFGKDVYVGSFSVISQRAKIADNVKIFENVYIGENVRIGENTIIHQGVSIVRDCIVGDNCIIHQGVVVGSEGFGFAPKEDGSYEDIPQLGHVKIGNRVSIGANTTIDRATIKGEHTNIGDGVKLDNLIQIAHNVSIGQDTVIAAQTGISGSTKVGKNCIIGGNSGIAGHLTIADNTTLAAMSGIFRSEPEENQRYMGIPAFNFTGYFRSYSIFRKLPDLARRLRSVEEKLLHLRQFDKK